MGGCQGKESGASSSGIHGGIHGGIHSGGGVYEKANNRTENHVYDKNGTRIVCHSGTPGGGNGAHSPVSGQSPKYTQLTTNIQNTARGAPSSSPSSPRTISSVGPHTANGIATVGSVNSGDTSRSNTQVRPKLPNLHVVNPDIRVHTVISADLDCDHDAAMRLPLGEVSDEQLLAEVARRRFDLHDKITDALVRETYDFDRIIGQGASGEVYLTKHRITKQLYACKVVRKDSHMNDAQSMSTEIEILKRLRHRHLVSLHELYETPKCIWIVLEYVNGGDLCHFLSTYEDFCEAAAAKILKQLLIGIHYMHSLGVVHRDLKLENILLTKSIGGGLGEVKIADFGLSALVRLAEDGYDAEESGKRKRYSALRDMWGTKEYFAPEVIRQAYGPQADVWAAGCVLYELMTGEQAFPVREGDTEGRFYGRICRGEYDTSSSNWRRVSHEVKSLIAAMLRVDPKARLSASECLNHDWITGVCHGPAHLEPLREAREAFAKRMEKKRLRKKAREAAERAKAAAQHQQQPQASSPTKSSSVTVSHLPLSTQSVTPTVGNSPIAIQPAADNTTDGSSSSSAEAIVMEPLTSETVDYEL